MALTSERKTHERIPTHRDLLVAADVVIWAGAAVVLADGYAAPATEDTGLIPIGRAEQTVDNAGGDAGDKTVRVRRGCFRFANSSAADEIGAEDIGATAYFVDDETVALTDDGGARSAAGPIFDVDADGVWVDIGQHETLQPVVAGGAYAPTMAGVTNVDGTPTCSLALYQRIGPIVRVEAILSVDPTAGSDEPTVASMTLPIPSDLGATDLVGVAAAAAAAKAGSVSGDATTNTARLRFTSSGTSAEVWHVSFTYRIVAA